MKTPFLVLLTGLLLPTSVMADPPQAVWGAPKALAEMQDALEKLKSPPDYAADTFLKAYTLTQVADEYVARKELTNAEFLYKEALRALHILQSRRPDWQPKIVSYRMLSLTRKIEALTTSTPSGQPPLLSLPSIKPSAPSESVPNGWRSFEFNGQKYYYAPLSLASTVTQKPQ